MCDTCDLPSALYKVSNIKVRFNLKSAPGIRERLLQLLEQEESTVRGKACQSYQVFTLRGYPYVFTCFYAGQVNATKLSRPGEISFVARILANHLDLDYDLVYESQVIDNITASGQLYETKYVCLSHLAKISRSHCRVKFARYDRERFCSCLIRTVDGTLSVFMNGKFNIVGAKSLCSVRATLKVLYDLTSNLPRSCPSSAGTPDAEQLSSCQRTMFTSA